MRAMRVTRGLSQSALASELGLDQAAVSRIEKGDRVVTVAELLRWCEALGYRVEDVAAKVARSWNETAGRPPSLWKGSDS
jgi:transcriptional regulator with XRE-family HTH domain